MTAPILLTDAPALSPDWRKARMGLLTASTAASVLIPVIPGRSRAEDGVYGTPLTEFARITSELQGNAVADLPDDEEGDDDQDDDERTDDPVARERQDLTWGNLTEGPHRLALQKCISPIALDGQAPGVFRHPRLPWLAASPDDMLTCPDLGRGVAELKAPTRFGSHKWHLGAPLGYVIQHAIQMEVMGVPWGILSALIAPGPRWQKLFADPAMWERIEFGLSSFWNDHILRDIPPAATSSDADLKALRALWPVSQGGRRVFLPPEAEEAMNTVDHGRALKKQGEALEKEGKAVLIPMLQDAEFGVLAGGAEISFKSSIRHYDPKPARDIVVRSLRRVKGR